MLKKYLKTNLIQLLLLSIFLVGCASRGQLELTELNHPLSELQGVTSTQLPVKRKYVSPNGREFRSEYFVVEEGKFAHGAQADTRYQAIVFILGDRRPYRMTIQVTKESKDDHGQFRSQGSDVGLARVIKRRIQNSLHKRRDGHNIIDDFRVF